MYNDVKIEELCSHTNSQIFHTFDLMERTVHDCKVPNECKLSKWPLDLKVTKKCQKLLGKEAPIKNSREVMILHRNIRKTFLILPQYIELVSLDSGLKN